MKNFYYRGEVVDVREKRRYLFLKPLYECGSIEVRMKPLSGRLVIFSDGCKLRDPEHVLRIMDTHYDDIMSAKAKMTERLVTPTDYLINDFIF